MKLEFVRAPAAHRAQRVIVAEFVKALMKRPGQWALVPKGVNGGSMRGGTGICHAFGWTIHLSRSLRKGSKGEWFAMMEKL